MMIKPPALVEWIVSRGLDRLDQRYGGDPGIGCREADQRYGGDPGIGCREADQR